MTAQTTRFVRRYQPVQRYLHWMGAIGFVLLFVTGSVLVWPRQVPVGMCCALRQVHRVGALLFALWPVLYALLDRHAFKDLIKEAFTWTRSDIAWFKYALPYFFGQTRHVPPQGRINAGQKLQHMGVILLSLLMGASGAVLMLGAGRLDANSLSITATIHDAGMLGLAILTIGHIYFVFLYGGLDAMLKGYVSEAYARMEHAKWLASLPESAFIVPGQKQTQAAQQKAEEHAAKPEIQTAPVSEAKKAAQPAPQTAATSEPKSEAKKTVQPEAAAQTASKSEAKKPYSHAGRRPQTPVTGKAIGDAMGTIRRHSGRRNGVASRMP